MSLKVTYKGQEVVLDEGSSALIGSGDGSTIQIARPGISRRHLAISHDGSSWRVEDAGSRNGTFAGGERIHVAAIDGPTALVLGHPTEGEVVEFNEVQTATTTATPDDIQAEIDAFTLPDTPPAVSPTAPTKTTTAVTAGAAATRATARRSKTASAPTSATNPDDLTAAIIDQIAAIKGLTWSVWAMIAVTAALCVLTLFVGILGG